MNSSDPPRPPSEATAARKKLPPSSREHFTSALVTSHGTPLPPDIAAYAIGAAFPPELVRPIAEALCTPERIEKTFHNYDAALLFELIEMDVNQTLLHIFDSVKKQRLTLWVLCVIPGPRNKMPSDRMEAERWKLFRRFLSQNGVSQDVIKRLRKCIAPWPKGAACAYLILFSRYSL
ncbi:hypothetical protein L227DRAFT_71924 [Lentinus tigrinus ALCF2SS1-6]|uniref:Uncharacterized protein n=1 Tax=Lentinus tigrinus ALCF2SS1-6 TaxID=1328759 RepID=A0A5C2SCU4_9APHY|nr:hypothetical protein L227DRAFT_71924 [Lentinus tigrinus ALCF2SS1-6]